MLYLKYVQANEKSKVLAPGFVKLTGPLGWWPTETQDVGDTGWMFVIHLFIVTCDLLTPYLGLMYFIDL